MTKSFVGIARWQYIQENDDESNAWESEEAFDGIFEDGLMVADDNVLYDKDENMIGEEDLGQGKTIVGR